MEITLKNQGKIIEGHVLDVNRRHFEAALKNYDSKLYTKWNWRKNGGNGCWEIRRKPELPYAFYEGEFQGVKLFTVEYVETDIVNHVIDATYLNYRVLDRIKEMDTWVHENYLDNLDYAAEKQREQMETQNREELRYQIKHHRKAFAMLQEEMKAGNNPLKFLRGDYGDYT